MTELCSPLLSFVIRIVKPESCALLRISLHLCEGSLAPLTLTSASSSPLCWKYKLEHVFFNLRVIPSYPGVRPFGANSNTLGLPHLPYDPFHIEHLASYCSLLFSILSASNEL